MAPPVLAMLGNVSPFDLALEISRSLCTFSQTGFIALYLFSVRLSLPFLDIFLTLLFSGRRVVLLLASLPPGRRRATKPLLFLARAFLSSTSRSVSCIDLRTKNAGRKRCSVRRSHLLCRLVPSHDLSPLLRRPCPCMVRPLRLFPCFSLSYHSLTGSAYRASSHGMRTLLSIDREGRRIRQDVCSFSRVLWEEDY